MCILLRKGWTPRDGCALPSAICITFQGIDMVFLVIYAPLFKG